MSRFLSAGGLIACAALAASPGSAAPLTVWGDIETGAVKVRYAQTDLASEKGARDLAAKVRLASAKVCGGDSPVIRRMMTARFEGCEKAAIERAVKALHSSLVAQALFHTSVLADR